jgi:hypothetical protein
MRIKVYLLSYKNWVTDTDDTVTFTPWDELVVRVNQEYQRNDDLRAISRELEISFDEVWEALGFKDEYDFN